MDKLLDDKLKTMQILAGLEIWMISYILWQIACGQDKSPEECKYFLKEYLK